MKLNPKNIRYLTPEDWRVLAAVEQGSRNHEVVPTPLIATLTNTRGAIHKSVSTLAKLNLIARVKNARYDGYRLTYGGLDYLALHAHLRAGALYSVGNQIGVGKESDVFVVASPAGRRLVLKLHRLGRVSFRAVKANRDYLAKGKAAGSWMHMSRLAALKEFAFMRALRDAGFPVPEPVACSRHAVVMELVDAFPLRQITRVPDPAGLYAALIELVLRLARVGLIHGDFNEFNILIEETKDRPSDVTSDPEEPGDPANTAVASEELTSEPAVSLRPILIDFPQMVSISHPNAAFYFDRDVACIKRFFERRFHFVSDELGPFLDDTISGIGRGRRLDVEVEASGFSRKMARELEKYMEDVGVDGDTGGLPEEAGSDAEDAVNQEGDVPGVVADTERPELHSGTTFPDVADGMTVLSLVDDTVPSVKMSHSAPSLASGTERSRQNSNVAKAASGWVI